MISLWSPYDLPMISQGLDGGDSRRGLTLTLTLFLTLTLTLTLALTLALTLTLTPTLTRPRWAG